MVTERGSSGARRRTEAAEPVATPAMDRERAAAAVLDGLCELDPGWRRLIEAARFVTGWSSWQLLGTWTARTLTEVRHVGQPLHPFFADPGKERR